jgi:hypothetical protein
MKHGLAETAPVGRMVAGLQALHADDAALLELNGKPNRRPS